MDANAGQVKYTGGDEVKIPKISLVGLGNYDRDKGFKQGSVTLSYETKSSPRTADARSCWTARTWMKLIS